MYLPAGKNPFLVTYITSQHVALVNITSLIRSIDLGGMFILVVIVILLANAGLTKLL